MSNEILGQSNGKYFIGQPRTLLYDREGIVVSHDLRSLEVKLGELSHSMIGRIVGYWESPRRSRCYTFRVLLIQNFALLVPVAFVDLAAYSYPEEDDGLETGHILVRPCENMAELCTEVPNPGTDFIVGSPEWRDAFHSMNGTSVGPDTRPLLRRVL
jgi:hypothetical protein